MSQEFLKALLENPQRSYRRNLWGIFLRNCQKIPKINCQKEIHKIITENMPEKLLRKLQKDFRRNFQKENCKVISRDIAESFTWHYPKNERWHELTKLLATKFMTSISKKINSYYRGFLIHAKILEVLPWLFSVEMTRWVPV